MVPIHTRFFRLLASCRIAVALAMLSFPALAVPLKVEPPKPAATIIYKDEAGVSHTVNPADHKLTAIHFWATWCVPCVDELPQVDAAQQAYMAKGFQVIALSMDGEHHTDKVTKFFTEHHIAHLIAAFDPNMAGFSATKSPGLPTTLFIDAQGNEIARAEGPLDWKSPEVTSFIEKITR